jgi:hypothetical protein
LPDVLNLIGAGSGIPGLGAYHDSVVEGKVWLRQHLKFIVAKCATATKLVLVGYSQGAQVAADVYQDLQSAQLRRQILGVALFGDPYFNASDDTTDRGDYNHALNGILAYVRRFSRPKFSPNSAEHVLSYCHKHDPICQERLKLWELAYYGRSQHKNYIEKDREVRRAANYFSDRG